MFDSSSQLENSRILKRLSQNCETRLQNLQYLIWTETDEKREFPWLQTEPGQELKYEEDGTSHTSIIMLKHNPTMLDSNMVVYISHYINMCHLGGTHSAQHKTLFRILGQFEFQHLKSRCSYSVPFWLCLAS